MPYVEKHCPYCNADEESHLMRDPDGHTFECDRCGCEWDERKPGEFSFAYDDPRENEGATP